MAFSPDGKKIAIDYHGQYFACLNGEVRGALGP